MKHSKKLPKEFSEGLKKLPSDEFAQKFYRPENKVYNWMNGKFIKPITDKESDKQYFVPVNLQIVVKPDGSMYCREI